MNEFLRRALETLGFRQRAYHAVFAQGSPGYLALIDLAMYSRAFAADADGLTHDQLLVMHGRRQTFFRIFKQIHLSPAELEMVARDALVHAAARLQREHGEPE